MWTAVAPVDAVEGPRQGRDPELSCPLRSGLHVRLVDLDDVGACREEVGDLVVDGARIRQSELGVRFVEVVLGLLRHRERARDGHLDRLRGVRAQELDVAHLHGVPALDRADDARHRVGVAAAVERRPRVVDVDAREGGREPVGVALAALLAVGQDVEAGPLLVMDRDERGVILGLLEVLRVDPPQLRRAHPGREPVAEPGAVDEPVRLRVGADEARGEGVGGGCGHRPQRYTAHPGSTWRAVLGAG